MKFIKRAFFVIIFLFVSAILIGFGFHLLEKSRKQKEYDLGWELYEKGLIKIEDGMYSTSKKTLWGTIVNESDKTILSIEFEMQMYDTERKMVYAEDRFDHWHDIPPNQFRKFSNTHYMPSYENSKFEWDIVNVRVSAK